MSRALCLQKVLSKRHSSCCIRTCRSLPVSAVPACRVVRELFVVSTWPLCSVLSYSGFLVVCHSAPFCPFLLWSPGRVPICPALSFPTRLLVVSRPASLCPFLLWPPGRVAICPALSFPTLVAWSYATLPRSVLSYSGLLIASQSAPLCLFLLWPPGRMPLFPAPSFPTLASWSCPTLPCSVLSYSGLLVVSHSALASTCSSSLCGRRDVKNLRTANNYLFWLPALPDANRVRG